MTKYLNNRAGVLYPLQFLIKSALPLWFALVVFAACSHAHGGDFLIGIAPSISNEQGERMFLPIAALLERATGERFRYVPAKHWPGYMEDMRTSKYSLLFDEPHLVGWRIENLAHVPVVKLSGNLSFVIAARKRDEDIVALADIAGHIVCAGVPPALDGLILFEQFDNPSRQPQLMPTSGFQEAYEHLVSGHCRAAVFRKADYEARPENGGVLRVLYLSESFPNWTLSADTRIPVAVLDRIRQALLDPANADDSGRVAAELDPGGELRPARSKDYRGFSLRFDNFWGLR